MIGQNTDLTIMHSGTLINSDYFTEIICQKRKFGVFYYYKNRINYNNYNVVIVFSNLRFLNLYYFVYKFNKKYKIIPYGIGVSASYSQKYNSNSLVKYINYLIYKKSDAVILYDNYPVILYSSMGLEPSKLFVAYNTVFKDECCNIELSDKRQNIIFIGSLYKEKGIEQLLNAYLNIIKKERNIPNLIIIGDGPEKENIEKFICNEKLNEKIILLGEIIEEKLISKELNKAILCISPAQAGLSVLNCFAHGVPFLTSFYPFSGGEFTSIIEGVTGFFYDGTVDGLTKKIEQILKREDLNEISINCRIFYERYRSPKVWFNGFFSAIKYVT